MIVGKVLRYKYNIIKCIGSGGFSNVYLAIDCQTQCKYAIKELLSPYSDERQKEKFYAEATVLKKLNHKGLPKFIDLFEEEDIVYLVLEYIEGDTLETYVQKNYPLDEMTIIHLVQQLGDILIYLHEQNPPVLHKDIKPNNIIVSSQNELTLIDFNAADCKQDKSGVTLPIGTNGFCAPEQYSVYQTDERGDIYALGLCIYFMLFNKTPVSLAYDFETVTDKIKPYHDKWLTIIKKCIAIDPMQRYPTVRGLLEECTQIIPSSTKKKSLLKVVRYSTIPLVVALFVVGFLYKNEQDRVTQQYESAILLDNPSGYAEAIEIHPEQIELYFKLLEKYDDQHLFLVAEHEKFIELWHRNNEFIVNHELYAELLDKILMVYLRYYREADKRINYANLYNHIAPFFEEQQKQQSSKAISSVFLRELIKVYATYPEASLSKEANQQFLSAMLKQLPQLNDMDKEVELLYTRLIVVAIYHMFEYTSDIDDVKVAQLLKVFEIYYDKVFVDDDLQQVVRKDKAFFNKVQGIFEKKRSRKHE